MLDVRRTHPVTTLHPDAQVMTASSSFAAPSCPHEWLSLLVPGLPLHLLHCTPAASGLDPHLAGPGPPFPPPHLPSRVPNLPANTPPNARHYHHLQHLSFLLWDTALMRRRLWRQPSRRPPRFGGVGWWLANSPKGCRILSFDMYPVLPPCWPALLHLKHAIPAADAEKPNCVVRVILTSLAVNTVPHLAAGSAGATR